MQGKEQERSWGERTGEELGQGKQSSLFWVGAQTVCSFISLDCYTNT